MVLTYSMVLDRLKMLNEREEQVRKFYKPLAFKKEEGKPYPHRHRFADVLEPSDVVRTIDKGGDDGSWDEGAENVEMDGQGLGLQAAGAERDGDEEQLKALRDNRPRGPSRESQRVVSFATKKERQLRKAIDGELNQRKETLKNRLYREAGIAKEGEKEPQDDENDKIDPLFKQVGKAQMMLPKPSVHKTGTATALEIKVSEAGPRFTSGAVYRPRSGTQVLDSTPAVHQDLAECIEAEENIERIPSAQSSMSGLSALQQSGMGSVQGSLHGMDSGLDAAHNDESLLSANEDQDLESLFEGPVSTWGYRRSVYSEYDDPDRSEFYSTQLTLPPEELQHHDPSEHTYLVHVQDISLNDRPEHLCEAAAINDQGKLLFRRAGGPESMQSTILRLADELPWVTEPTQLFGQTLLISIYRRRRDHAPDAEDDVLVSERELTFRATSAQHAQLPPSSAPAGARARAASASSTAFPAAAPAERPDTAQASPPRRREPWVAQNEGSKVELAPNPIVHELSRDKSLNRSMEESPAAKKKKELSRMRQQMRASLQQTQSEVLASMGGKGQAMGHGGAGVGDHSQASRLPGVGGNGVVIPMSIVSRPTSTGPGSSPSRPTSQNVRFR